MLRNTLAGSNKTVVSIPRNPAVVDSDLAVEKERRTYIVSDERQVYCEEAMERKSFLKREKGSKDMSRSVMVAY